MVLIIDKGEYECYNKMMYYKGKPHRERVHGGVVCVFFVF